MDNREFNTQRRVRGVLAETSNLAKQMRHAPTPAEETLWQALRGRRLGNLKFRFQHAVRSYILDFYCPAKKLVIEVDGAIHDDAIVAERDRMRQEIIRLHGYQVLRFANDAVINDLDAVLERILAIACTREDEPTKDHET
jgi:very-short-patch-repair endonuclease